MILTLTAEGSKAGSRIERFLRDTATSSSGAASVVPPLGDSPWAANSYAFSNRALAAATCKSTAHETHYCNGIGIRWFELNLMKLLDSVSMESNRLDSITWHVEYNSVCWHIIYMDAWKFLNFSPLCLLHWNKVRSLCKENILNYFGRMARGKEIMEREISYEVDGLNKKFLDTFCRKILVVIVVVVDRMPLCHAGWSVEEK